MLYNGLKSVIMESILQWCEHCDILCLVKLPTKDEIEAFLKEFSNCWDGTVVNRQDPRNDKTLDKLGLTPVQRAKEVRKLGFRDYFRGPSPDHKEPTHELWEFGRMIDDEEVYIKIKVYISDSGKKYAKCISCHFPDEGKPLTYPYKKSKG